MESHLESVALSGNLPDRMDKTHRERDTGLHPYIRQRDKKLRHFSSVQLNSHV